MNHESVEPRWFKRWQPRTLRQTLTLGLLPGLVVVVILTTISWYAIGVMAAANAHIAETSWELSTTRTLQLTFQQALIPFNNFLITDIEQNETSEVGKVQADAFHHLANDLDQLFAQAGNSYEEAAEHLLLDTARARWEAVHAHVNQVMQLQRTAGDQPALDAEVAQLQEDARFVWDQLEQLHDMVLVETRDAVQASHTAQQLAISLIVLSAIAALVPGSLFVFFFSRYITRPIEALEAGAARIGGGDLAFRVSLTRQDEIGALTREFNHMAEQLQDVYGHLEDRVAQRTNQLRTLHQVSQSVVGEQQLDRVLQIIADLARSLGTATYSAVMVPRRRADQIRFFVSQNVAGEYPSPPPMPEGRGLLGLLLSAETPVRLEEPASHPAAQGVPPGHPPMRNLLGVPIRIREHTIGAIYVTDKEDGQAFTGEDEDVFTMLAAYAGIAIENARLYEDLTTMNEALEARVQERTVKLEAVSAERTAYAAQLRRVLNRTVQVQEDERQRIGKDIHDGVSQWLMGALFELQAARVRLPDTLPDVAHHLAESQRVLKNVKEEMRRVIYDLHPPLLESHGLVTALRGHLTEVEAHCPLRCSFDVQGRSQRLAPAQELALFRICQEAVNNVVSHAETDHVQVILDFQPQTVCLTVADHGLGFDPTKTRQDGRTANLGLLSMAERAISVGAQFQIDSIPGQGATICVRAPLDPEPALAPHALADPLAALAVTEGL